ncbi:hypothetical protein B0A55_04672 [Friedmanniomyces simplex]|uniref:BTB domain-containing protein n=1 Tax=Friedmanniomyces simplex TaxID=329884 RepID=A0A4U0XYA0_9PEZI|nr:hypothetical protein B0A55_04672 [Friedmanniomyces simplex]
MTSDALRTTALNLNGQTKHMGSVRACSDTGDYRPGHDDPRNEPDNIDVEGTPKLLGLSVIRLERLSVTVLVGEDGHSFSVHEGLLCENSPFFTSAMKKEWAEGQKREIPLPDDKPEVFNLYAEWKYTGKLLSRLSPSDSGSNGGELTLLIDAYVFGEKVQDRDFQDATLDALIMSTNTQDQEGKKWFPSGAVVRRAYRGTLAGSPIRRLLVDMHNHNGGENWIKEENDEEFLVDLVREMYASRARPQQADPTRANVNSCSYHHHTEDRLCYDHTAARR